jgi:hypothetical protein
MAVLLLVKAHVLVPNGRLCADRACYVTDLLHLAPGSACSPIDVRASPTDFRGDVVR